jgi:uncharacterized membrane protein YjjP (DUF1212 family)
MGSTGGHAAVSRRFLLQLARALHTHGTPAHRLETALAITARRLGLEAEFFSTPTSIMVGIGNLDDQRVSLLRVEPGEPNLGHLSTLGDITRGVIEGTLSPADGLHQVEALDSQPPPYPQWLVLFAFVCSSAAVSCFLKVRAGDVLTASLLGLLTGVLAIFAVRRESTRHVTEPLAAFVVTPATAATNAPAKPPRPPTQIFSDRLEADLKTRTAIYQVAVLDVELPPLHLG